MLAPSGAPTDVQSINITASTATLVWGTVPCTERNSNITHYSVRYVPVSDDPASAVLQTVDGDGEENGGRYTLSGLLSLTNYSVRVAAVNQDGEEGPYSEPIFLETETCSEFMVAMP